MPEALTDRAPMFDEPSSIENGPPLLPSKVTVPEPGVKVPELEKLPATFILFPFASIVPLVIVRLPLISNAFDLYWLLFKFPFSTSFLKPSHQM